MLISFDYCANLFKSMYGRNIEQVLHVGAHLGEEAPYYAEAKVKKVAWAEGNPELIPNLMRGISGYSMIQSIIPFALWNVEEELDFYVASNYQSSSLLTPYLHKIQHPQVTFPRTIKVKAVPYDSLHFNVNLKLGGFSPDFLNIDIQGSELMALQGMHYILTNSVQMVYTEVNYEELYLKNALKSDLQEFLANYGFVSVCSYKTKHSWGDSIFVKEILVDC